MVCTRKMYYAAGIVTLFALCADSAQAVPPASTVDLLPTQEKYKTTKSRELGYYPAKGLVDNNISLQQQINECTGKKYCICISALDARPNYAHSSSLQSSLGYLEILESHYGFNFQDGTAEAHVFMETNYHPTDLKKGSSVMDAMFWKERAYRKHIKIEDNRLSMIEERIHEIVNKVNPDDLVFFSFNGHGSHGGMSLHAHGSAEYEKSKLRKKWIQENFFDKVKCTVIAIVSCCHAAAELKFKESNYKRIVVAATSADGVTNSWFDLEFQEHLKKQLSIERMVGHVNVARLSHPGIGKSVLYSTGNRPSFGPSDMIAPVSTRKRESEALRLALLQRRSNLRST